MDYFFLERGDKTRREGATQAQQPVAPGERHPKAVQVGDSRWGLPPGQGRGAALGEHLTIPKSSGVSSVEKIIGKILRRGLPSSCREVGVDTVGKRGLCWWTGLWAWGSLPGFGCCCGIWVQWMC